MTSGRLLPGLTAQRLSTQGLPVPQLNKTMNAETAGHAGTLQSRLLNTVNIDMFRHPKYYKELRKRNKETQQEPQRILDKPGRSVSNSDQVISLTLADGCNGSVHPGPGHKRQATSSQASSGKHQALRCKHQATSRKQQAPGSGTLQKVSSTFDQGTLPR